MLIYVLLENFRPSGDVIIVVEELQSSGLLSITKILIFLNQNLFLIIYYRIQVFDKKKINILVKHTMLDSCSFKAEVDLDRTTSVFLHKDRGPSQFSRFLRQARCIEGLC